ncbi:hypothetical protein BDV18DRAFT_139660 [Aspergillus unguis]
MRRTLQDQTWLIPTFISISTAITFLVGLDKVLFKRGFSFPREQRYSTYETH